MKVGMFSSAEKITQICLLVHITDDFIWIRLQIYRNVVLILTRSIIIYRNFVLILT